MKITSYLPSVALKPFIQSYEIIESKGGVVNRVVPSTSLALAFRFKGKISYINGADNTILPSAAFSGLRKSVRLINYAPGTAALIVLFKETAASQFFKQPLHMLFEQSISLDYFFPKTEISILEEQLAETDNDGIRITLVEEFLLSKLSYQYTDSLIVEAIAKIYACNGNFRIKELANHLCMGQDAFEKRFRRIVGTTPKQFSFIVKMKNIIQQNPAQHLIDTALNNGYYDQPHFNKDFKIFTGQSPTDFFKSRSHW